MTEVLVVLRLDGDWATQGFRVMAEIGLEGDRPYTEIQGSLPPNPSLLDALGQWRRDYRTLQFASRIKPLDIQYKGSIHFIDDCKQQARALGDRLQQWLQSEAFRPVDQRLRECLNPVDQIRILVRSDDQRLWVLPWHLWTFLERYPNAEVVFSSLTLNHVLPPDVPSQAPPRSRQRQAPLPPLSGLDPSSPANVKILAILGHDEGIDVDRDRHQLATIPNAEVTLLVKPQREQLNDQLWDQAWDILFFAGHSQTQIATDDRSDPLPNTAGAHSPGSNSPSSNSPRSNSPGPNALKANVSDRSAASGQGFIEINSTDSLSLPELSYGLKRAIAQGLQLAIFNSCDGLGLVTELERLNLPQAITMQEPIPDVVAHTFLTYFLTAFAQGAPLHLAERQARERLQALEKEFPCASWLPLLYQNAATTPVTWRSLLNSDSLINEASVAPSSGRDVLEPVDNAISTPSFKRHPPYQLPMLATGVVTVLITLVRWLGGLEAAELRAYDQFTRLQPSEPQDERLLIITIDSDDIDYQRTQGMDLTGSLSPQAMELLFQRLGAFEPISVGLDIYEPNIPRSVEQSAIPTFGICKVPNPRDSNAKGIAPPVTLDSNYIGFSDFPSDRDSILRRQLLALKNPDPTASCTAGNGFNLLLALHYLEVAKGIPYDITPEREFRFSVEQAQKPIRWRRLTANAGGYRGIDAEGYQLLLRPRKVRSLHNIAPTIPLRDLLTNTVAPDVVQTLQGRIILVGVTDFISDVWITPHSQGQTGTKRLVPGVIMQAQMVSQLLSSVLDQRSLLWWWPDWLEILWIGVWSGIGSAIGMMRQRVRWIGAGVGGWGLLWGISVVIFRYGGWIPVVPGAIAFALALLAVRGLRPLRNANRS